jgi:hypothetical protein
MQWFPHQNIHSIPEAVFVGNWGQCVGSLPNDNSGTRASPYCDSEVVQGMVITCIQPGGEKKGKGRWVGRVFWKEPTLQNSNYGSTSCLVNQDTAHQIVANRVFTSLCFLFHIWFWGVMFCLVWFSRLCFVVDLFNTLKSTKSKG